MLPTEEAISEKWWLVKLPHYIRPVEWYEEPLPDPSELDSHPSVRELLQVLTVLTLVMGVGIVLWKVWG
jgi:hypothetical protein